MTLPPPCSTLLPYTTLFRSGDVDDRTLAAREQVRGGSLAEDERGRDVEVERPLEETGTRVEEGPRHRPACIVHDRVDSTELSDGTRDDLLQHVVVVDVRRDDECFASGRAHVGRDLVELLLRARGEHDVRARICEGSGDRRADASPRAGDDRDLAVEPERVEHAHARYREIESTMATGFSPPSRSIVMRTVACTPPGTSLASRSSPRARTRELTGTGAGKRTLSAP